MPQPANATTQTHISTRNSFVRVARVHAPAARVLAQAALALERCGIRVSLPASAASAADDYAQFDPALQRVEADAAAPPAAASPSDGLGYAGLSPEQRAQFVAWLDAPHLPAPRSFLQLYLAWLETWLLEDLAPGVSRLQTDPRLELRRLAAWPQWRNFAQFNRTFILACRLDDSTELLEEWIAADAPPALFGIALGLLAARGGRLSAPILIRLTEALAPAPMSEAVAQLRLESLSVALGGEPLEWALAQAGDPVLRPWRCAHRDLRLALTLHDLLPPLQPHLAEMMVAAGTLPPAPIPTDDPIDVQSAPVAATVGERLAAERQRWQLTLEFGHSRSEYFDFVLVRAQRLPQFTALLDENRHIVYRINFRRGDMRRFWSLWEYVKSWSGTRVYVNGVEIEHWKVWPYSQYL